MHPIHAFRVEERIISEKVLLEWEGWELANANRMGWVQLRSFFPRSQMLCYGFGRLSFFLRSRNLGVRKWQDVTNVTSKRESERESDGPFFSLPPRAVNSSKAEGDSNSELSSLFRDSFQSWGGFRHSGMEVKYVQCDRDSNVLYISLPAWFHISLVRFKKAMENEVQAV